MKTLKQIKEEGKIINLGVVAPGVIGGYTRLPNGRKCSICIDSNTQPYEHASFSIMKNYPKEKQLTPSWEDMCYLKDLIWNKDEQAIQIHPKESEYLHGVAGLNNVLHLWAAKDGDWQTLLTDPNR